MSSQTNTISALRVPADGSGIHLAPVEIKTRPEDDCNADFFDDVADLSPWLGDVFKQGRVSDFSANSQRDSRQQFPGFVQSDNSTLYGQYCLYFTIEPSLPINQSCLRKTEVGGRWMVGGRDVDGGGGDGSWDDTTLRIISVQQNGNAGEAAVTSDTHAYDL